MAEHLEVINQILDALRSLKEGARFDSPEAFLLRVEETLELLPLSVEDSEVGGLEDELPGFLESRGSYERKELREWALLAKYEEHNILSLTHEDSTEADVVAGDIIRGEGSPAMWTRLPIGYPDGKVLTVSSGVPEWETHLLLSATHSDTVDSVAVGGDIIYASGTTWSKLTIGDTDDILKVSAGVPTWEDPAVAIAHTILSATHTDANTGSDEATGDIIYRTSGAEWENLPIGSDGHMLIVDTNIPAWADPVVAAAHTVLSATHTDSTAGDATKGDVIIADGSTPSKWIDLAVGSSEGDILTVSAGGLPTWETHDLLGNSHTDVVAPGGGIAVGDITYVGAGPAWGALSVEDDGDILTLVAGSPAWVAAATAGAHTLMSATHTDTDNAAAAKGDIIYSDANGNWAKLAASSGAQYKVLSLTGADTVAWDWVRAH